LATAIDGPDASARDDCADEAPPTADPETGTDGDVAPDVADAADADEVDADEAVVFRPLVVPLVAPPAEELVTGRPLAEALLEAVLPGAPGLYA
jgi:hypothetical protein